MKVIKNKGQDKIMNEIICCFVCLVDLSVVQVISIEVDVCVCVELVVRYNIIFVYVLFCWMCFFSMLLLQQGMGEVMIGGLVGFFGGGYIIDIKVQEVWQLIVDGVWEVDMVVNIGKVFFGDYDYVCEDLCCVVEVVVLVLVKVIFEMYYFNEEQICCVCDIVVEVGMKWVKIFIGWVFIGVMVEKVSIIVDQFKG